MEVSLISDANRIPKRVIDFKREHFKEIFKEEWERVFDASPLLAEDEQLVVFKDLDKIIGSCIIKRGIYSVRIRGFLVFPEFRGKGFARRLMQRIEIMARYHHSNLIKAGDKPSDINLMYLKSLIYLDSGNFREEVLALQFGNFLKRIGFKPYAYNRNELSKGEIIATQVYKKLYPDLADNLRVFKKVVVDNGVDLKPMAKQELLSLNKKKWDTVMEGLNWKLGNYGKTGRVSYRYDLCPICKDVGSNRVDSKNCKECYIYITCREPFRKVGRFKEDFEISNAYFSAVRNFMLWDKIMGKVKQLLSEGKNPSSYMREKGLKFSQQKKLLEEIPFNIKMKLYNPTTWNQWERRRENGERE